MTKRTLSTREVEEMYCEMLDDCYGTVKIAGLEYETSRALADVDPTAFRCGLADYISSLLEDGQFHENADGDLVEGAEDDEESA